MKNNKGEVAVLEKGKLLDAVMLYRERKKYKDYMDMLDELVTFKETLELYAKNVALVDAYTSDLMKRFNKGDVSEEEAKDNFVKYISNYKIADWGTVINKLKKNKE